MEQTATAILIAFVFLGVAPVFVSCFQFAVAALHGRRNHYPICGPSLPRVVVLIPAWNEGRSIGRSVDMLMQMNYPETALRVLVVDDASTDETPHVMAGKIAEYGGRVVHLRRAHGGQGKAHTLNHGLHYLLSDSWTQAVLIMDADVLFETNALRKMIRHLADPEVGAVTAYIKVGSYPGNVINRSIAFEYATAQAVARRAQNVLGTMACLAGGAQLHTRENIERLGGRIDTSSLAEDTFTTFETQLAGKKVVFDANAVVWAEEPNSLRALWRQRLRWARGNLQLTARFAGIWFRPSRHRGLGSLSFGVQWFSVILMPLLAIASSLSLLTLHFSDDRLAWTVFSLFWLTNALPYLFVTASTLGVDPGTARRAWFEGVMFPGAVSLCFMGISFFPHTVRAALDGASLAVPGGTPASEVLLLLMYSWPVIAMAAASVLVWLEDAGLPSWLRTALLLLVGYGAVLCAITLASYMAELRRQDQAWEKTEKFGQVRVSK